MNFQTETNLETFEKDTYGYKDLSKKVLDNVLLKMELPNVFGLYGNWGSGKTTFIKFIQKHINDEPDTYSDVATVMFHPWKYEYSTQKDLLLALLIAIRDQCGLSESTESWKKIGIGLLSVATGLARNLAQVDIHSTQSDIDLISENLLKEYENWDDEIQKMDSNFVEMVSDILESKSKTKIIVFIDDLDRCLPENTVKLLEAIKNFLHVPGVLFVLSVDRRVVSEMIEKKYDLHSGYGDEYLMKIIPYYYELQFVDLDVTIKEILTDYGITFTETQIKYVSSFLNSEAKEPRVAKYYLHKFCMNYHLNDKFRDFILENNRYLDTNFHYAFVASFLYAKFQKVFIISDAKIILRNARQLAGIEGNPNNREDRSLYVDESIDPVIRKSIQSIMRNPIIQGRPSSPPTLIDDTEFLAEIINTLK